jgi:DNA (cytosine-5)-methyltransferase 1
VSLAAAGNTYEAGTYTRAKHISSPLYTQHTTQAFGFASMPSLVEMRGGGSIKAGQHPITRAAHTVTAGGNHHGLVSPSLFHERSNASNNLTLPYFEFFQKNPDLFTRQLATMMAALRNAAASNSQDAPPEPISYDELMRTHFRMLQPDPELRRVMAFEDDYILLGNKTEMTSGLGNAVTPPPATWITERCLATLRGSDISAHYQAA